MTAKITKLARPADPTVDQVFEEFLAAQRARLAPRTFRNYDDVIELLRGYLNGYGHQSLPTEEAALFRRHYDAEGDEHREFCQLFGPEKIVDMLGGFLGYYMIRKVVCGEDFKRAAGTVAKKLSRWLAEQGYVAEEAAREGVDLGAAAARDLPRAERAADMLRDATDRLDIDVQALPDDDYLEFDYLTIVKVEPGRLWVEVWEGNERTIGPIPVPKAATELLRQGWRVSCSLARIRGTWHPVEMANVYPG